jgi:hypothetical protein
MVYRAGSLIGAARIARTILETPDDGVVGETVDEGG